MGDIPNEVIYVIQAIIIILFGAVDYFAVGGQTVLSFPYELLNTLPYLMTLLALTIHAAAHNKKTNK